MHQDGRPHSLASYQPDEETSRRLMEYLNRLPWGDPRMDAIKQQLMQQRQGERMSPTDTGTDPGLGGLREYNERMPQSGVVRP